MLVAAKQDQGAKRLRNQFFPGANGCPYAVQLARNVINSRLSRGGQRHFALDQLSQIVAAGVETKGDFKGADALFLRFARARGGGQNKRRTRFIDKNAVDLVNNTEIETTQNQIAFAQQAAAEPLQRKMKPTTPIRQCDAIAQIVESQFLVGAVGQRIRIGLSARIACLALYDGTNAEAKEAVQRPHLLGIAPR